MGLKDFVMRVGGGEEAIKIKYRRCVCHVSKETLMREYRC